MDCPGCGEPMVTYELDGVETDRCLSCGGTWLDRGELARLCELNDMNGDAAAAGIERAPMGDKGQRRCPRCNHHLRLVKIGEGVPVEIDRCPHGHGIWLDKGEMAAALVAFQRNQEGEESVKGNDRKSGEEIILSHMADLHGEQTPPRDGEE